MAWPHGGRGVENVFVHMRATRACIWQERHKSVMQMLLKLTTWFYLADLCHELLLATCQNQIRWSSFVCNRFKCCDRTFVCTCVYASRSCGDKISDSRIRCCSRSYDTHKEKKKAIHCSSQLVTSEQKNWKWANQLRGARHDEHCSKDIA